MLIEKTDVELKDIVNKKMTPGKLLLELAKCGLNIMPVDEDAKAGGIHIRNRHAEEKAILEISTCLRSFAFRSSKWNRHLDTENVNFKMRENLEFDREFFEDHEPDWKYMMFWHNKCCFVETSDEHEHLKQGVKQGHVTHATLPLAVNGHVSEEAHDRCYNFNFIEFADTVK